MKLSSTEEFNLIKNEKNDIKQDDLGLNDLNNNFETISIKTNSDIAQRNKKNFKSKFKYW